MTSVHWFRRDLRLGDNPALLAAVGSGEDGVLPLFVLDPVLLGSAGPVRRTWLDAGLRALDQSLQGSLHLRRGDPAEEVLAAARAVSATTVHITGDAGPYGRRRDARVRARLAEAGVELVATSSPYAVAPGRVRTKQGDGYAVFTPFRRAWQAHGWPLPAPTPPQGCWLPAPGAHDLDREGLREELEMHLPAVGEQAATVRWERFRDGGADGADGSDFPDGSDGLDGYAERRNRPDLPGTSGLSADLRWGHLHPRTLLADLAGRQDTSAAVFVSELAWREFYADVLWHRPDSAHDWYRPEWAQMRLDQPGPELAAWQEGRTGYPFVDAGMRQLRSEGWMHNRLRMVVASFLVKDLHLDWRHGARWFMRWLRDGDLASNQHGWQWVAGSGTDAAPYFRVFNPVTQGLRFDPEGAYVRRHVPELAHLPGPTAHTPWDQLDGYAHGYARPLLDHAEERVEALARYQALRGQ